MSNKEIISFTLLSLEQGQIIGRLEFDALQRMLNIRLDQASQGEFEGVIRDLIQDLKGRFSVDLDEEELRVLRADPRFLKALRQELFLQIYCFAKRESRYS